MRTRTAEPITRTLSSDTLPSQEPWLTFNVREQDDLSDEIKGLAYWYISNRKSRYRVLDHHNQPIDVEYSPDGFWYRLVWNRDKQRYVTRKSFKLKPGEFGLGISPIQPTDDQMSQTQDINITDNTQEQQEDQSVTQTRESADNTTTKKTVVDSGSRGGLRGNPPSIFDGNRAKADDFIREFTLYQIVNSDSPQMKIPFERVALALTFMRGPLVNDWVNLQMEELQEKVEIAKIPKTDQNLWDDFVISFKDAFTDTAKHIKAYNNLVSLKMEGGDIDTYIATFERLARQAGWTLGSAGTIEKFKLGLPKTLFFYIMRRETPPTTYAGWTKAARDEVRRLVDIKAQMTVRDRSHLWTAPAQAGWTKVKSKNVDYMDVDKIQIRALTASEREKLRKENKCFYCKKQGNITKNCRKRLNQGRTSNPAPSSGRKTEAEEEEEQPRLRQSEVDEIVARIRGMTDDMKQNLNDQIAVDEMGFH